MAVIRSEVPPDLAFLQWLITDAGMLHPRPIPGGRWAAVRPMIFTHAVAVGRIGDQFSVDDSWCYPSRDAAKAALDAWTGYGEPAGWIRHPGTGRRLSETGAEFDQSGGQVGEVGVIYVGA